jgi:WD40 repeat protein
MLAFGSLAGYISIRDISGPRQKGTWERAAGRSGSKANAVSLVEFSPDGKLVAAGGYGEASGSGSVSLWSVASGEVLIRLPTEEKHLSALAFSPDGKALAIGEAGALAYVVDLATRKRTCQLEQRFVTSIAYSPCGTMLATTCPDGPVQLWNATTGKQLSQRSGHIFPLSSARYSGDGKVIATLEADGSIGVWDSRSLKPLYFNRRTNAGTACRAIAISPRGSHLYLPESDDSVVALNLDDASRRTIYAFQGERIWSFALSTDGKSLAIETGGKGADGKYGVRVVDVGSGNSEFLELKPGATAGPAAFSATRLCCSPNGRYLAVAGCGTAIHVVDLSTRKEVRRIDSLAFPAMSAAVSSDGRLLVACEGTSFGSAVRGRRGAKIWDVASGKLIAELMDPDGHSINGVVLSPDGKLLCTVSTVGAIRHWESSSGRLVLSGIECKNRVSDVAYDRMGQSCVSGMLDGTALIWSLSPFAYEEARDGRDETGLDMLWKDLGGEDARRAYEAIWSMSKRPEATVEFLMDRLRAARVEDVRHIRGLIVNLGCESFSKRESAGRKLAEIGVQAEAQLREALAETDSAEVRARVKALLVPLEPGFVRHPESLRAIRAIWVLQRIGTSKAQVLLRGLARGAALVRQTQEAQAALDYLERVRPEP